MDRDAVRAALVETAAELGFGLVGVARLGEADEAGRVARWLAAGRHADMAWLAERAAERQEPRRILRSGRSVVALATFHPAPTDEGPAPAGRGRVARYARGRDYHNVVIKRLRKLRRRLVALVPELRSYGSVDNGPVLERHWGYWAGLGWFGLHGGLIHPEQGSWFSLATLLLDQEMEPDAPRAGDCGRCGRCVAACPTGAIVGPGEVDARHCIAYLTIEHRGPIPRSLRAGCGDRVFGCDICQEVCPHNRRPAAGDPALAPLPERRDLDLRRVLGCTSEGELEAWLAGSPLRRAHLDGLKRNALLVLGNQGDEASAPLLDRLLGEEPSPMVRGHAAWALGRLGGRWANDALDRARRREPDPWVMQEILHALEME